MSTCATQTHPDIEKEKALKRAERFGTFNPDLEAEKKKARAARFGVVSGCQAS
jgi:SAP domain-containing ribonucleoprotein